ncbi:crossover junction endodeoxyribonuclease RuvC [uncultured Muribaculum sp.]|uniref:crossover junction endodeoxyribonuclease RuvC n=1 Tax=uncultured Muribaculum sp. TaxID=1918613 RepID=UPI0025B68A70|nr:crossover junction endodeoxyribonuclease RuvC [uncultured Muribaculum sp.]
MKDKEKKQYYNITPIGNTLSLDCATLLGWSVAVENQLTDYGEIKLKHGEVDLWKFLEDITEKYNISRIVAENIFYKDNVRTFQRLANYHGVINLFCQLHGLELITKGYQPTEWKRALLYDAYATKDKVRNYINRRLNTSIQSDNITDAIAILFAWMKKQRVNRINMYTY